MVYPIGGVEVLDVRTHLDERGVFTNIFSSRLILEKTSMREFQVFYSYNVTAGTLRGFHFQKEPSEEFKFIFCLTGEVCDILVDVRPDSPSYGLTNEFSLSGENGKLLLVPPGVAHGYQTLRDHTSLIYAITGKYEESLQERFNPLSTKFIDLWPLPATSISIIDRNSRTWPIES